MGKGMGAVDKNMRKELSLEIDGHACPDQYVNDFTPLEFEEIVDLFKEFDKDKSGYIDEEELCEMMRALEMDHSLAKAKEMMLEIVLTQRLFPNVSELQVRVDGVNAMPRHRDAVDVAVRESTRLVRGVL